MNKSYKIYFLILTLLIISFMLAITFLSIPNYKYKHYQFHAITFGIFNNNSSCHSDNICFNWSSCFKNNIRYRNCYDINLCKNLFHFKQYEKCNYLIESHCNDNKKDFDESDIDCGGSCKPCQLGKNCNTFHDCENAICDPKTKKCVEKLSLYQKITIFSKTNPYLFSFLLLLIPTIVLLIPFFFSMYLSEKKEIERKRNKQIIIFRGYVKLFYKYLRLNEFSRAKDAYYKALKALEKSPNEIPKDVFDEVKDLRSKYKKFFKSKYYNVNDNIPDDEFNFDIDDL